MTGKFLRHSQEFYEWRIQDRLKRLEKDPNNLALLDDLGVAYQKTGQTEKAIETMERKEQIQPGVYETYSNWGTFYILAGDFEKGLPLIDKALEINPDAHFGREKYQKWLVEYAMSRREEGVPMFPIGWGKYDGPRKPTTFSNFVAERLGKESLSMDDARPAVKGVLGMMRFADHDNPLLLEALADLLIDVGHGSPEQDAKRLAARSLLLAATRVDDAESRSRFRERAEHVLSMQTRSAHSSDTLPLSELEADFSRELADAKAWYDETRAKELQWIADGVDVDAEFDKLYSADPEVPDHSFLSERVSGPLKLVAEAVDHSRGLIVAAEVLVALFLIAIVIDRRRRKRGPGMKNGDEVVPPGAVN